VKVLAIGRDFSEIIIEDFEEDFGAIFSFYEDGTYSADMDGVQLYPGTYTFDEDANTITFSDQIFDTYITESTMELSYTEVEPETQSPLP